VPLKIQLGTSLTQGLGAGNRPERGREAAIENLDDVINSLGTSTRMVFITAGMGGGTGTGAAPVIAQATRKQGILTVGIVTFPFRFEGNRRIKQATEGIREFSKQVDSLLIIQNEKLREIFGDLSLMNAFERADDILMVAAKGIAEIITVHGHVNVDFADVETVMSNSGIAVMGTGVGEGERRALDAVEEALNSPLLNNNDIYGARNILVNIISGKKDASMDEIGQINDFVQEASGQSADLIWGSTKDANLGDKIAVTVIATGFKKSILPEIFPDSEPDKEVNHLNEGKRVNSNLFEWGNDENSDDDGAFDGAFEEKKQKTSFVIEDKTQAQKEKQKIVYDLDQAFNEGEKEFLKNKKEDFIETKISTEKKEPVEKEDPLKKRVYKPENDLELMENEPAYKRKKVSVNIEKHSDNKNISKFSLTEDEDGAKIRKENSFLNNRVD
jgi:cell division protein FtsZ